MLGVEGERPTKQYNLLMMVLAENLMNARLLRVLPTICPHSHIKLNIYELIHNHFLCPLNFVRNIMLLFFFTKPHV